MERACVRVTGRTRNAHRKRRRAPRESEMQFVRLFLVRTLQASRGLDEQLGNNI